MASYPDPIVPGELYWFDARVWATEQGQSNPDDWKCETADAPSWGAVTSTGPDGDSFTEDYFFTGTVPAAGTDERTLQLFNSWGSSEFVIMPAPAVDTPVTAEPPLFDPSTAVYVIPELEGVRYLIGAEELAPGIHTLGDEDSVTITAEALGGYVLQGVATWTLTAGAGPGGDGYEQWAEDTAQRVGRMVGGRASEARAVGARDAVDLVAAFVAGYTGGHAGRGWGEDGVPVSRLTAVIVVAAVRLASNPRQVSMYTTSDYTERPAILAGWTLAERAVLRRYRRVTA